MSKETVNFWDILGHRYHQNHPNSHIMRIKPTFATKSVLLQSWLSYGMPYAPFSDVWSRPSFREMTCMPPQCWCWQNSRVVLTTHHLQTVLIQLTFVSWKCMALFARDACLTDFLNDIGDPKWCLKCPRNFSPTASMDIWISREKLINLDYNCGRVKITKVSSVGLLPTHSCSCFLWQE